MRGSDGIETLAAFYDSVVRGLKRPSYDWVFEDDGSIKVSTPDKPKEVKIWKAHNPEARDFRLEEVGPIYNSEEISLEGTGPMSARSRPQEGVHGLLRRVDLRHRSHYPLKVTSDVRVLPEVLPHKGIAPTTKNGGSQAQGTGVHSSRTGKSQAAKTAKTKVIAI